VSGTEDGDLMGDDGYPCTGNKTVNETGKETVL
jgi:hypothetical protein